jgi:hypothetical protein
MARTGRTVPLLASLAAAVVLMPARAVDVEQSAAPVVAGFRVQTPPNASGREYHVAPAGRPENDGTVTRPLDLATALSRNSPARPGDVIWLHGGTYHGSFVSVLSGTRDAPIVVRQFPGERATIDSAPSKRDALLALGRSTWYWGFEITSSHGQRASRETGPWPEDLQRGPGITARGPNLKFINLVVHDTSGGVGIWEDAIDTEVYGSLIYYNGWIAADRGHGHGIYTQNPAHSVRMLRDNILFQQFSHGIHAYGSELANLDNIIVDGNVAFRNGEVAGDLARDILVGGGRTAHNPVLTRNFTYGGAQVNVGYSAGCENGLVLHNYFAGGSLVLAGCTPLVAGNTFVGTAEARTLEEQFPQNRYDADTPGRNVVQIRMNRYERGRAHIIVYNWEADRYLDLDLGSVCASLADRIEVRDAQNLFGEPVASGKCSDEVLRLPLTGLKAAAPVGDVPNPPRHTAPEFAAFVALPVRTGRPLPEAPR